jgi:hypothetical protein
LGKNISRSALAKWETTENDLPADVRIASENLLGLPQGVLLDPSFFVISSNDGTFAGGVMSTSSNQENTHKVSVDIICGGLDMRQKATAPKRKEAVPAFLGPSRIYIEESDGGLIALGIEPGHVLVFERSTVPKLGTLVYLENRSDRDKFLIRWVQRNTATLHLVTPDGDASITLTDWEVVGYSICHATSLNPFKGTVDEDGLVFTKQSEP